MWDWDNNLFNLRDILADLYWDKFESRRIVIEAGINPAFISFKDSAIGNWFSILDHLRFSPTSVAAIIDIAIREQPSTKGLLASAKDHALNLRGTDIIKDVDWRRPLNSEQLEKIIGKQSTILPISFLELGMECAKAVAMVNLGKDGRGSGFLIGDDLLLTNHHVLKDEMQSLKAKVQFNYQRTSDGLDASYDEYVLDPDGLFETSKENDWTAVKVKPKQGELAGKKWGSLRLSEQDPMVDDFTIIIQHPNGGPKQIALYHNFIVFIDSAKLKVQYLTDTEPGSSGSPVFDTDWNVIALHHSGGWLREPGNDSHQKFYRNEGIHINAVIAGLKSAGVI
jgi:V8-like Glu-specific endopeptidase